MDDAAAWEAWLANLEFRVPVKAGPKANIVTEGWKPLEDLCAEIIRARATIRFQPKQQLIQDAQGHKALRSLVSFLRHPDPLIRAAAWETLRGIQEDRLPLDPDVWEAWLR